MANICDAVRREKQSIDIPAVVVIGLGRFGFSLHAQTDLPADIRELTEKLPQPSSSIFNVEPGHADLSESVTLHRREISWLLPGYFLLKVISWAAFC